MSGLQEDKPVWVVEPCGPVGTGKPDYQKGDVIYPVPGFGYWPHLFVAAFEPVELKDGLLAPGSGKWYYALTPASSFRKATSEDARFVLRRARESHERATKELQVAEELAVRVLSGEEGRGE